MRLRTGELPEAAPRIVKIDGRSLGILTYDVDNGYPQRMDTLINACSTAKQCANLLSDYVFGQGFDDEGGNEFYKAIINDKMLTPDKLLRRNADDKSKHRGFAIHVNYNALFQISSVNYIAFETARIGIDEYAGKYGIYSDWYNTDRYGKRVNRSEIKFIHRYNPKPEVIQAEVDECGGWENYLGQVFWHSDDFENYPLSSIDEVIPSVEAEIESDKTTTNNLKNNFQLKAIVVMKGKPLDEDSRTAEINEIHKFIGGDGKQVVVTETEDPDGKDVMEVRTIDSKINDKIFQYTDEKVRAKIYRAFRQPAILHSDYMGTNGFNKDQLADSQEYYTNYTHPTRILFEEVYTDIFSRFHEPINPSGVYSIVPLANLKKEETADGTTNI